MQTIGVIRLFLVSSTMRQLRETTDTAVSAVRHSGSYNNEPSKQNESNKAKQIDSSLEPLTSLSSYINGQP